LLRWRLLSAGVILAVLLSLVWLDAREAVFGVAGVWLAPVLVVIAVAATEEMLSLLRAKGHRPVAWVAYVGNFAIVVSACMPIFGNLLQDPDLARSLGQLGWPFTVFAIMTVLAFCGEMQRYEGPGRAIVDVGLSVLTMAYVGVLSSFWAALRLLDMGPWGLAALISMLFIVKLSDVGAYATGRTLKAFMTTHKMTPILSPGKTIEGGIGALVAAVAASWVFFRFLAPWITGGSFAMPPAWAWISYGLVLAVVGMLGDLAESLIKRDMERKDSSTWMPGLGGVLDVVDSVLTAAPVAYLFWALGLLS
jgi:phosphatidate cytidylyltransferase